MARVVVSGYYGFGNAGDEAVLAGLIQEFRRLDPAGEITVLSADSAATARIHGAAAVERTNLRAVDGALARADLLVSGGGSLLQDVTSLRSLLYYLGVMALARRRGVPVFFYAQGVGPLRRPLSRWLVRRAAEAAAGITVRDQTSAALLRELGVREPPVAVTADPAFALQPEGRGQAGPADHGKRPVLGFAFRPWPGEERWVPAVAEAAGELSRRYGAGIRWLVCQPERDRRVALALQAACPVPSVIGEDPETPQEMLAELAACDLVVGARLHALILGVVAGRPVVGVSYDPKVEALLHELGLSPAGRLPGLSAAELVAGAGEAWERREELMVELQPRLAELRRRSASTAELALACARPSRPALDRPAGETGSAGPGGRVTVLGVGVDPVTLPEAVERIAGWIGGRTRQVVTLNPEMVMKARRQPALARVFAAADLVTADGVGIVWAARRLGQPLPGRVTGVDLVGALLEKGARAGWRFFFLGAAPGVAEEAARRAAEGHPGLQVAGTHHGYFSSEEADRVARIVAASAPDVLLVALGSPAQEEFIARYRERLGAAVALGVGGTLDVLAGKARRAPAWLCRLGLEWAYRVARQPSRLGRAMAIPAFMWAVRREAARRLRRGEARRKGE